MRTPARSSSARTRRTRTRSSATSATGRSPRPRWSSTCAAAAQASSSKPSQSACAGGSAASSRAIAANGWSSGTSVSTTSAGASPSASSAMASRSAPPASIAIHAEGRWSNKSIGRRRLGRVRGPFDRDPGELLLEPAGPPTAPSSASRAACHHAGREVAAIDDAARASSRAVAATRCGRMLEAAPVATHPFGAPALARQQLCRDQRVERGVEAALAVGRGRRPERRGEGARRLDARHPGAEAREGAPGRREELDERHEDHGIAPRHRRLSRPVGAVGGDVVPTRFARAIGSRSVAPCEPPGSTRAIVFIGNRWGLAAPARGRYVRMIVPADTLLTSAFPAPPPATGTRIPT